MANAVVRRTLVAALVISTAAAAAPRQVAATAHLEGNRNVVAIFLPPPIEHSRKEGSWLARTYAETAIFAIERCLGTAYASYRVVYADRIVIGRSTDAQTFDVGQAAPLTGAILFHPGSNARVMYAGGGAQALVPLVLSATGDYFGKRCDRD